MNDLVAQIKRIIIEESPSSQQIICQHLEKTYKNVSQATVSRILKQLGVTKVKDQKGRLIYHLSAEDALPDMNCQLLNTILTIESNQSLVIIKTMAGAASLIARALDFLPKECGILGTIAGDDSIFIALSDDMNQNQFKKNIIAWLSNEDE